MMKDSCCQGLRWGESECEEHVSPGICDPVDCSPPGSSVLGILQQEYWSGLPCPLPVDLSDSGIKPASPALQANSLMLSYQGSSDNILINCGDQNEHESWHSI